MAAHGINLISVCAPGDQRRVPRRGRRAQRLHLRREAAPRLRPPARAGSSARPTAAAWSSASACSCRGRTSASATRPRSGGATEETGRLLAERKLRNVFVNLYQEFNHPFRVDHEIFREPDGAAKKAKLTGWFKAVAPDIEAGICPNHQTGSPVDYPGCEVRFFQEKMPIPEGGFAVNAETADRDAIGQRGRLQRVPPRLRAEGVGVVPRPARRGDALPQPLRRGRDGQAGHRPQLRDGRPAARGRMTGASGRTTSGSGPTSAAGNTPGTSGSMASRSPGPDLRIGRPTVRDRCHGPTVDSSRGWPGWDDGSTTETRLRDAPDPARRLWPRC